MSEVNISWVGFWSDRTIMRHKWFFWGNLLGIFTFCFPLIKGGNPPQILIIKLTLSAELWTRCVRFATSCSRSKRPETDVEKVLPAKFSDKVLAGLAYNVVKACLPILSVLRPSPLAIPECRRMWKVEYHPQAWGLLFNNYYSIMDTHLTLFLSLFICHSRALPFKSLLRATLTKLWLPEPVLFSIFLYSSLLYLFFLWPVSLSSYSLCICAAKRRKPSACTLSLGVTCSIMKKIWLYI